MQSKTNVLSMFIYCSDERHSQTYHYVKCHSDPHKFDERHTNCVILGRLVDARSSLPGEARRGQARPGEARRGQARPGEARRGQARPGEARRGQARQ